MRENRLSDAAAITEASYLPYVAAESAWIAETKAEIVGFGVVDEPAKTVWALFVDPKWEGAGVGRALQRTMLQWARDRGIARLSLSTQPGSRAVQFYKLSGWSLAGMSPDGEVRFERSLLS